jgi:hypothetical protein
MLTLNDGLDLSRREVLHTKSIVRMQSIETEQNPKSISLELWGVDRLVSALSVLKKIA